MIPRKRPRARMGVRQSAVIDCPAHRKYVRSLECACSRHCLVNWSMYCQGPIDAHHQKTRGAGGGDEQCVPLCRRHHSLLDSPHWSQARLEAECNVDFEQMAKDLWAISPAAKRYRMKQKDKAA